MKYSLLILCAALPLVAQTVVQDTIATPGAAATNGTIRVRANQPFISSTGHPVAANIDTVVAISAGAFSTSLYDTPSGYSYQASYQLTNGTRYVETWVVPVSVSPVGLSSVRVATVPSPSVSVNLSQLTASGGVNGECIGFNGTNWVPVSCGTGGGSVTITGSNGITVSPDPITSVGTVSGVNAAADGSTKGVSAFIAADFNAAAGVVSLDYVNGQKATDSIPGFLSAADHATFSGKQASGSYITALTGDVIAAGPGSVASVIGAGKVTNAMLAGSIDLTSKVTGVLPNGNTTAASANTASAIVARDVSGNFTAGTITAALTGNSSTATALAANPPNCSAGNLPRGVDASGVAEGCAKADLTSEVTGILPNANTTATNLNTASAVVARDASGNFTAGTITAALTGTASGNLTSSNTATLTNKTYDTAGAGNTFSVNSNLITGVEGNSAKVQLFTGSDPATNDCAKFDVNHNLVTAGSACSGGSATSVFGASTATAPAFSATPTFSLADAGTGAQSPILVFPGVMIANITAVTITSKTAGARWAVQYTQDGIGGHTLTHGASATGTCERSIDTNPNATTLQWYAVKNDGSTVIGTGCTYLTNPILAGAEVSISGLNTPGSGMWICGEDSTGHNWQCKGNASSTPSVTVFPDTGASNNFLTGISSAGAITRAQPAFTNISGTAAVAQGGTGVTSAQGNGSKVQLSTGSTTTNNCVKFDANGNTVDAGAACGVTGGGTDARSILSKVMIDGSGDIAYQPQSILGTQNKFFDGIYRFGLDNTAQPTVLSCLGGSSSVPSFVSGSVTTANVIITWASTKIAGDVYWDFDYSVASSGSLDPSSVQRTQNGTTTTNGTAWNQNTTTIALTAADFNSQGGNTILFNVCRDGTKGGDTLAGSAVLFDAKIALTVTD